MPYTLAVMKAIVANFDVAIHCVCWDENKRSPFVATDQEHIHFYKRSSFNNDTLSRFIEEKKPELIYVSGRMDKLYLQIALTYKKKGIPTVTGSDNQWTGTTKDHLSSALGYFLYRKYFSYMWVAGTFQYEFAKRIGYNNAHILKYTYSADTVNFNKAFHKNKELKKVNYPHTIVFVGRFIKIKGIDLLAEAFTELKKETGNDWKLCMVGNGELNIDIAKDSSIEIKAFMSSEELALASKDWGAFCLPSTREPWGVVVHEFAAAGLPIIAADCVGATDAFLVDGYNGRLFSTSDKNSLKAALNKLFTTSDDELNRQSMRSNELSNTITPEMAAYSLMSVLNKK